MKIDIVIAVAQCGGVENVINDTASYLQKQGWRIRVVQLIWEGVNWLNRSVSFYPLLFGKDNHDLEELVKVYGDFIKRRRTRCCTCDSMAIYKFHHKNCFTE